MNLRRGPATVRDEERFEVPAAFLSSFSPRRNAFLAQGVGQKACSYHRCRRMMLSGVGRLERGV